MKLSCIMKITCQGVNSHRVMNSDSIARTAPMPSNTAPNASAARISQRNMLLIARVLRAVTRIIRQDRRRFQAAASVAEVAPTAELSTRDVNPITNRPVMVKKIRNGMIPARNSASFSPSGIASSASDTTGARSGFTRQRTQI